MFIDDKGNPVLKKENVERQIKELQEWDVQDNHPVNSELETGAGIIAPVKKETQTESGRPEEDEVTDRKEQAHNFKVNNSNI